MVHITGACALHRRIFTPVTAYAKGGGDTTPPSISAELSGDTLHIEADDEDSGVDAVYIGTKRINYRVDHAIDVEFEDYAGTETETVGVYAIDFAGNQSEVVEVKNPHYEGTADTEAENSAEPNPFTPAGQASVLDNATDGGRQGVLYLHHAGGKCILPCDRQPAGF